MSFDGGSWKKPPKRRKYFQLMLEYGENSYNQKPKREALGKG